MMTMYISPYHRMARFRDAMNRLVEESITEKVPVEHEMLLPVDVQSEDDAYVITAQVPGLNADDINIEVVNDTVTIRGEFKPVEKKDSQYLVCELPTGRFSRVINLPVTLDPTKAEAQLHNGIFTLRAPKAEAHRPKIIKVKDN